MPNPIETIAARVLAEHREQGMTGDGIAADGEWAWLMCSCGWRENFEMPEDDILTVVPVWEAHVAAEIARAIAEDEGLREVGADAVRLIFYPPNTEVSGTDRRYSAAVIAALTANREDQTDE